MELIINGYCNIKSEMEEELKNINQEENKILETIETPKQEENKNVIKKNSTKYVKKFIEKNSDKIKSKTICPTCYSSYTYFNKSKHFKTKRHLLLQNLRKNNLI